MIERVVSGGQIGADRGGLDGAIQFWGNTDRIGGWCPANRRAEDGPIPFKYPLQETVEWSYPPRTKKNVQEADGTVIFTGGPLTSGSKLTVKLAEEHCKPYLHFDITTVTASEVVDSIADWVDAYDLRVLNVAGSRESTCPGLQEWTASVIHDTLVEIGASPCDSGIG